MSQLVIYPGSFDPITLGHLSVLTRAAKAFNKVQLLVVHNSKKSSTFSISKRVELAKESLSEIGAPGNINVEALESGLLVDYVASVGASAILKGFRSSADIENEMPMAQVNRDLSGIETVFLPAEAGFGFVSSSLVREVASLGGDVTNYVTKAVALALSDRYSK